MLDLNHPFPIIVAMEGGGRDGDCALLTVRAMDKPQV